MPALGEPCAGRVFGGNLMRPASLPRLIYYSDVIENITAMLFAVIRLFVAPAYPGATAFILCQNPI